MIGDVLDLIFPRICPVCGQQLLSHERLLCSACLVLMPYTHISDFKDNLVARMFFARLPIERAYSHLFYRRDEITHDLLMRLKYNHRPDIGWLMGRQIATALRRQGFFEGVDALVPVPLHWWRWLKRGYNQSAQLAKGISEATGIPVCNDVVWRTKNNASQTGKGDAATRLENVQGIFKARATDARHIMLVDDVLTTGATTTACAEAILAENPDVRFSIITLTKA